VKGLEGISIPISPGAGFAGFERRKPICNGSITLMSTTSVIAIMPAKCHPLIKTAAQAARAAKAARATAGK
jgi:hypothetical protein